MLCRCLRLEFALKAIELSLVFLKLLDLLFQVNFSGTCIPTLEKLPVRVSVVEAIADELLILDKLGRVSRHVVLNKTHDIVGVHEGTRKIESPV